MGIQYQSMVDALREGEAVILPTDTVYGLGVSSRHVAAPETLYAIKQREKGKPIAWLVGDAADLSIYGQNIPSYARLLAQTFWPGALTLVVFASARVPAAFCSDRGTIGLRMPKSRTALEIIRQLGCPIATTSANISGEKSPQSFDEIEPSLFSQVGAWLDDKEEKSGLASTVVDCTGPIPLILREGAITCNDIQSICKEL